MSPVSPVQLLLTAGPSTRMPPTIDPVPKYSLVEEQLWSGGHPLVLLFETFLLDSLYEEHYFYSISILRDGYDFCYALVQCIK